VVVNNFTNINKTNNHLSPQIIEYEKEYVGNPGPSLGKAQKCQMIPTLPLVLFSLF
jgi:hypothetical protein